VEFYCISNNAADTVIAADIKIVTVYAGVRHSGRLGVKEAHCDSLRAILSECTINYKPWHENWRSEQNQSNAAVLQVS
jgi:hypothetical protein